MTANAPSSRSIMWAAADMGGFAVFSILGMLVMARFISPADFGLASLAVGIVQIFNSYVEGLLHDALIQRQGVDDQHFASAFWLVVGIGLTLFGGAATAAYLFHDAPGGPLLLLTAATAASLPFSAVVGISNARLRKDFRYDTVAIPSVSAKVLGAVLGVGMAYKGFGAWSLVAQFVSTAAAQAAGLMIMSRWAPRFTLSFGRIAPLWRFAMPYALMNTVVGARTQGFTGLIAAVLGFSTAGFVNVAFRLTVTPQVLLSYALANVGLPLLSRHQDAPAERAAAFETFSKLVAVGTAPIFFGMAACANRLVPAILGEQWLPSVLPMQIFALGASIYFLRLPSSLLLRSLGRVKYSFFNSIMHIAVTLGGMFLFHPQTAMAATLWWIAPLVPLVPLTLVLVARNAEIPVATQLRCLIAPVASASLMAAAVLGLDRVLGATADLPALALCVTLGAAVYATALFALDGFIRRHATALLRRRFAPG